MNIFDKMNSLPKNKQYQLLICLILMFLTLIIISLNFDEWFQHTENIRYSDGCQENYTNGKLTTPECPIKLERNKYALIPPEAL